MLHEHYVNIIWNYITFELFFEDEGQVSKYLDRDVLDRLDTELTALLEKYSPYTEGRLCPFPYGNVGIDAEIRNWKTPEIEMYSFDAILQRALQEKGISL